MRDGTGLAGEVHGDDRDPGRPRDQAGTIAGPKILEHIVDVVLYFEGDYHHSHRLIRAAKNRYGATNELGIFEMSDQGLVEIADPAGLFLQDGYPQRTGERDPCRPAKERGSCSSRSRA